MFLETESCDSELSAASSSGPSQGCFGVATRQDRPCLRDCKFKIFQQSSTAPPHHGALPGRSTQRESLREIADFHRGTGDANPHCLYRSESVDPGPVLAELPRQDSSWPTRNFSKGQVLLRISAHTMLPAAIVSACLFCCSVAAAKKPTGGGNGDSPAYVAFDFLGFDNGDLGYQSYARFLSERDGNGGVTILGTSWERYASDPFRADYPAMWFVDGNDDFNEPLNLGHTTTGNLNLDGANNLGDFVGDSYVYVPGLSYQLLGGSGFDINDAGQIIGSHRVDPVEHNGHQHSSVGGLWQLNVDGSISGPESLGVFYPIVINNSGVMAGYVDSSPAIA